MDTRRSRATSESKKTAKEGEGKVITLKRGNIDTSSPESSNEKSESKAKTSENWNDSTDDEAPPPPKRVLRSKVKAADKEDGHQTPKKESFASEAIPSDFLKKKKAEDKRKSLEDKSAEVRKDLLYNISDDSLKRKKLDFTDESQKKKRTRYLSDQSPSKRRSEIFDDSLDKENVEGASDESSKEMEDTSDKIPKKKNSKYIFEKLSKEKRNSDVSGEIPKKKRFEDVFTESLKKKRLEEVSDASTENEKSEDESGTSYGKERSPSSSPLPKRRRKPHLAAMKEKPKVINLSDDDYEDEDDEIDDGVIDDYYDSADDDYHPGDESHSAPKRRRKYNHKSKESQELSGKRNPILTVSKQGALVKNISVTAPGSGTRNENSTKPVTVQVKKVVKGSIDGEIHVLTSYEESNEGKSGSQLTDESENKLLTTSPEQSIRTYSGPVRKLNNAITKTGGRKYMILDKATIKGMMEKGLIQAIGKDGTNQQPLTYKAILPKAGPSILRRIGEQRGKSSTGSLTSLPPSTMGTFLSTATVKQTTSTTSTPTIVSASNLKDLSSMSGGVKIQLPYSPAKSPVSSTNVTQVITAPVFVKSQANSGVVGGTGPMQVVTLPPAILNQLQKGGSLMSIAVNSSTGGKSIFNPSQGTLGSKSQAESNVLATSGTKSTSGMNNADPDEPEPVEISDGSGEEGAAKEDEKYGVPTGICKVLKSMKMYQYIDKGIKGSIQMNPVNKGGIRWVAVPTRPGEPDTDVGPKLQKGTPPPLPITTPVSKDGFDNISAEDRTKSTNIRKVMKQMKLQHARLIGKHRTRYSRLQKKHSELERDYKEVEDVGTKEQIVRDSKSFLSEEHALFMESQMFMKNCDGKGNRFTKRFMQLMLDLYRKSPAGYRYLKTIFTIPSVKMLLKLENRGFSTLISIPEKDPNEVMPIDNEESAEGSSRSLDNDHFQSVLQTPHVNVNIKSEVLTESDELSLQTENGNTMTIDNKDWFKSSMMLTESQPSTSGQTVFMNNNIGVPETKKMPSVEVEEDDDDDDDGGGGDEDDDDDGGDEDGGDEDDDDDDDDDGDDDGDDDDEEEEMEMDDDDASDHDSEIDQSELAEVGEMFENVSKKVMIVPDGKDMSKEGITIQWDEAWEPL